MRKFNKILALGLVGVSTLTGGLALTGCDMFDKGKLQDLVIDQDAVPYYVVQGEFDEAKIPAILTYSNGKYENITLTESMLSERDKERIERGNGDYSIIINYQGLIEELTINIMPKEVRILDNVMHKMLEHDFVETISMEYEGEQSTQTVKYDADNKILYSEYGDNEIDYSWLENYYYYEVYADGPEYVYAHKYQSSYWKEGVLANVGWDKEIFSDDCRITAQTLQNNTYEVYVDVYDGDDMQRYTYIFNDNKIERIVLEGLESEDSTTLIEFGSVTVDYTANVELTVPNGYKVLAYDAELEAWGY